MRKRLIFNHQVFFKENFSSYSLPDAERLASDFTPEDVEDKNRFVSGFVLPDGTIGEMVVGSDDDRSFMIVASGLVRKVYHYETPQVTYLPTDEGWLYLAGHKDLFNGEIVGYAMGERLTGNLVSQSLLQAVAVKRPAGGLIHHSDRGSQYCAYEYQRMLGHFDVIASMSDRGNCFDNAPMESFWGTLKQELVHHRHYTSRQEAIRDITEYIEIFYNRQRKQARLGFRSPAAYAQTFYDGRRVA